MEEKYTDLFEDGKYKCSKCGAQLFDSDAKFKSSTRWPSFRKGKNIAKKPDNSFGMQRIEILCEKCGQHLGHVFDDGKISGDRHPDAKMRYCVLSDALEFVANNGKKDKKEKK